MLNSKSLQPSRMWSSSFHLALAATTCIFLSTSVFFTRLPDLFIPNLTALLLLCSCVLILWIGRKKRSDGLSTVIYIETGLIVLGLVYVNHETYIRQELLFMPFIGIKILCVALALTAPPKRWVGLLMFALCAFVPVFQYYSWPQVARLLIAVQEPWITSIFAICGVFLYFYRCRVFELLRKEEQAEALRRYSHLLLASQHLLNTPLQVIELSTSLITQSDEERKRALENIEESMATIRHLNQLLSFGETSIKWDDLRLPGSIEEFEKNVRAFKAEMAPQKKI